MIKIICCIAFIGALGSMAECIASEGSRQTAVRTFPSKTASHYKDIFEAAKSGDLNTVRQFIEQGVNLRAVSGYNGDTILHFAAESGNLALVRYLVEQQGLDPRTVNNIGVTVLHLAAYFGNLDIFHYLIEHGADPRAVNNHKDTVLRYAANSGNLDIVRYLVEHGADPRAVNKLGETILHKAARSGNVDIVRYLVEHGADPRAIEHGDTVLDVAELHGRLDIVRYLREQLTAAAASEAGQQSGQLTDATPAEAAERQNVRTFPSKPASSYKDILEAAKSGDLNAVRHFYDNPPFLIKIGGRYLHYAFIGSQVLLYAVRSGNIDLVRYLVEQEGLGPRVVNRDGETALHSSAFRGNLNLVRYLVEKGADPRAVT